MLDVPVLTRFGFPAATPCTDHCQSYTDVCIVGAVRTPFGTFQGSLAGLSATQLGAMAIQGDGQV